MLANMKRRQLTSSSIIASSKVSSRRSLGGKRTRLPGQAGIATILMVLLISLAMTVAALGVVYTLRGTQEMQVAAHATTHSQASAWAGVEAFRRYLYEIHDEPATLAAISGALDMSINSVSANLSAQVVSVTSPTDEFVDSYYDVKVNIRSEDEAARSTSVLQVVYRVSPFLCSGGISLDSELDFQRDLNLGGSITVLEFAGTSASFQVDGSVNMENISVSGIDSMYATGDIVIGSNSSLQELWSNGDIILKGGSSVGKATAAGGISMLDGGTSMGIGYANDDIVLDGSSYGTVSSRSNIQALRGTASGALTAGGTIELSGVNLADVSAVGNVIAKSGFNPSVDNIYTESDLVCENSSWAGYTSVTAAGNASGCAADPDLSTGQTVSVPVMSEISEFSLSQTRIDAWAFLAKANYVFEPDGSAIKVTVADVSGVTDGVYYIGSYNGGAGTTYNFLCETVNGSNECTSPTPPSQRICMGYSDYNRCLTYDSGTDTWNLGAQNMAPGLVWFKGNAYLGNGHFYNTFAASGNITTDSQHVTEAINYAGYAAICESTFSVNPNSYYTNLVPLNFCDTSSNEIIYSHEGNVGLVSGGYDPSLGGTVFEGGSVSLGASSKIYGTVLAGDMLTTAGQTEIHGYVTASGQGSGGAGASNSLGGSTTINLETLPSGYAPTIVPNMNSAVCNPPDSEVVRSYWTRYL